jgi:myo-inositol-1(or 4)-monophosphatase
MKNLVWLGLNKGLKKMKINELEKLMLAVKQIANSAAKIILDSDKSQRTISKKGRIDLVTDVDLLVNNFLCEQLHEIDPSIDVIAEEGVDNKFQKPSERFAWIIDPIDGTTNFAHRIKHAAISIALYDRQKQESLIALVLNPFRNENFTAIKKCGAFLNENLLQVSDISKLEDAVVATGFSYDQKENPDNNLAEFSAFMPITQGMRRFGAASLDLAYVAVGCFDGYFEKGLKFWDYAAGMLLVKEAGGRISGYDGCAVNESSGHIMATNAKLHPIILSTIQAARAKAGLNILPM